MTTIHSREVNIADAIEAHARRAPWATACIDSQVPISFARLNLAVHRAAHLLASQGIGPGMRVGTTLGQTALHLVVVLAIARLGATSLALRALLSDQQRIAVARRYGVTALVRHETLAGTPGIAELVVGDSLLAVAQGTAARIPAADPHGLPWRISLSSGTTGVPKAIATSHASLLASAWLYRGIPEVAGGRRNLIFLDLNAAVGMNVALRRMIAGDGIVLVPGVSSRRFFGAVDLLDIDSTRVSPHLLNRLIDEAPAGALRCPGVQIMVTGGALPATLRERAFKRLSEQLVIGYGSTETGTLASMPAVIRRDRPDAAGRLLPWVQAEAVDRNDLPLPFGEPGRLRFRGPEVADAYLDDPEASARSFRDGWFYPGDLGSIASDGMLLLAGRADEMLDIGGLKVNANEVDAVLLENEDVADAAAFAAVSTSGQPILLAAVVSRGRFDEAALIALCRQRLGNSAPRRIVAIDSLPRNAMGKLERARLTANTRVGKPSAPDSGA